MFAQTASEFRRLVRGEAAPMPEWAVGSAVVTTTSLSVGYIVWMVRGGYLLASVLSTMPVWQNIDTLDALDGVDDDDESLASLAHWLKGVAGTVVTEPGIALMATAREERTELIEAHLEEIRSLAVSI